MATNANEYIDTNRLSTVNGLQFIHLNVRSIFPKIEELKNNFLTSSMDIICFTETWLHGNIKDLSIDLPGYDLLRNDRLNKRGGGTCIFVNQRLHYEPCLPNVCQAEVEMQSITLLGNNVTSLRTKPIIIVVIYRPPQSNYAKAHATMVNYLNALTDLSKKELIILGDLNWDYLDKTAQRYNFIRELELEFGVEQKILMPTRCSLNKSSLIDIILTNMNNVMACGCLDVSMSDHYPTFLIKKRKKIARKHEIRLCRSYKNYDKVLFMEKLSSLDWSVLNLLSNVDDMWNMILQAITYETNIMCPVKQMRFNISKPEWFSSDLYELAKERDQLFRKFRQSKKRNVAMYQKAVKKRRDFSKLVKSAKETYFKEHLKLNQNNVTKYWNTISEVLGQKTGKKIDQVYLYGTNILCNEEDTANIINEFFATVGERVSDELGFVPTNQLDSQNDDDLCDFPLMSTDTFLKIISELKSSKPSGITDINSSVFIDSMFAIPNVYTKLCNYSLSSGKFPSECKLARISIIPKKGDTSCMDNLRPISILSILGKVIEKFVKKVVVEYFEANDMFYKLQYGFRSGRSTIDAVFYLVDKILKNKNDGLFTSVAFLDLTKAFNCVHYKISIDKLYHYGFRGTVLQWFESYLSGRQQFTKLNEYTSDIHTVNSGVPQGSVLGPILYLIYINDIGCNEITSDILMFADDSVLIQTSHNETTSCTNLELDLVTITNYFKSLRLGLNPKKTKIMHFDRSFKRTVVTNFPPICINGVVIESVDTFKYLQ